MKNTQKGRSMVEMLGVLAIIGVLSVGGIAGYTVAMNRYRANQILDMASKLAVIAQTANSGAGGVACVGTGCAAGTDTGMVWSATGGVTSLTADATANNAGGTDTVTVTLGGDVNEKVQAAMENIAGTTAEGDTSGVYTKPVTVQGDNIIVKTN